MATSFSIESILTKKSPPTKPSSVEVTVVQTNASVAPGLSAETRPARHTSAPPENGRVCQTGVIDLTGPERSQSLKRGRDGSSIGSSESSDCNSEVFLSDSECALPPVNYSDSFNDAMEKRRNAKRPRTAFTAFQLKSLEYYFKTCPYPDSMARDVISRATGIEDAKIQVWFQNRRARYRKRYQTTQPSVKPKPKGPSSISLPVTPMTTPSHQAMTAQLLQYYAAMSYFMQSRQSPTTGQFSPWVLTKPSIKPQDDKN